LIFLNGKRGWWGDLKIPVMNMVQALNLALREEMERDQNIIVMGEDVGKKGGVFLVTEGLQETFGEKRVIDTPLTEGGIIGIASGMAVYGLKPVVEIQFIDFIYEAFDQILTHVAKLSYRTAGELKISMVIRAPYGGGVKGGQYHSQSPESYFIHTSGLKVIVPSTPKDAKGLLKAAIRDEDPVIFMEPKRVYRLIKEDVPEDKDFLVPIGKARIVKKGDDITLVAYGSILHEAIEAAEIAESKHGISVEVIDLRSLLPWDKDTVLESLEKTGRLIVVHEAPRTLGFASEIISYVTEKGFFNLLAPPMRVTGWDTPYPLVHEWKYLPNKYRILKKILEIIKFR